MDDIIDSTLPEDTSDAYAAVGIERAESASTETEMLHRARTLKRERKMTCKVALEKQTANALEG